LLRNVSPAVQDAQRENLKHIGKLARLRLGIPEPSDPAAAISPPASGGGRATPVFGVSEPSQPQPETSIKKQEDEDVEPPFPPMGAAAVQFSLPYPSSLDPGNPWIPNSLGVLPPVKQDTVPVRHESPVKPSTPFPEESHTLTPPSGRLPLSVSCQNRVTSMPTHLHPHQVHTCQRTQEPVVGHPRTMTHFMTQLRP
jgi:hypothetical protein